MKAPLVSASRALALVAASVAAVALSGCNAVLTDVWQDTEYQGPGLHRVLVVADRNEQVGRRLWEDQLQGALADRHIDAVPSYRVTSASPSDSAAVWDAVAENGFDGAIVVQQLPTETSTTWVPGQITEEPVTWYNRRWNRYTTVYRTVHHPGYPVRDRVFRERILVWSKFDGPRLIWAATAEVTDPNSASEIRQSVAHGLVPELVRSRVL